MPIPLTLHRREQMKWRDTHTRNQVGKCACCGQKMYGRGKREPTLDHIIPLSKGGKDTFENTQALCRECNECKADSVPDSEV